MKFLLLVATLFSLSSASAGSMFVCLGQKTNDGLHTEAFKNIKFIPTKQQKELYKFDDGATLSVIKDSKYSNTYQIILNSEDVTAKSLSLDGNASIELLIKEVRYSIYCGQE